MLGPRRRRWPNIKAEGNPRYTRHPSSERTSTFGNTTPARRAARGGPSSRIAGESFRRTPLGRGREYISAGTPYNAMIIGAVFLKAY